MCVSFEVISADGLLITLNDVIFRREVYGEGQNSVDTDRIQLYLSQKKT